MDTIDTANETPNSFKCSGISSAVTEMGKVVTANDDTKRVAEKLTSGIQFNASTSKPMDLHIIYTPRTIRPIAVPMDEIIYNN